MKLDRRGEQYPRLVIDTKKTLESRNPGEMVEVLIDNGIAAQNLNKMVASKGLSAVFEKIGDNESSVKITVSQRATPASGAAGDSGEEPVTCQLDSRKEDTTVTPSLNLMGHGDPELRKALMKGSVYALTQQDILSETILLHNSGAYLFCEGSDNLEDLGPLESQGVEILTCGTCLNLYGLSEKLQVGSVTNIHEIVERMTASKLLVHP